MGNTLNPTRVSRYVALLGLWLTWFGALTVQAQDGGNVAGVVVSTWDGSPLAGVTVTVRGTTLAVQTGANGQFELKNIPVGDQELRFSKSGYAAVNVPDVRVLPGQTTAVNGNLRPEFYEMEEYEVTAEEFQEQTEQIMIERQQSSSMMDAIGSDQFSKLGAGDAAEALGKVSGASIADGKFAVIRGLADRYTSTTMNGTDLPSADPDRKAAQLDLIPSKFIERIDVNKTFSPDLPGGFAGGAINIVTRKYPSRFEFSMDMGVSYNTQANLQDDFLFSDQGSTDWLAMDDGTRKMPDIVAASNPSGTTQINDPAFKSSFKSTQFAPIAGDSSLNPSLALSLGDTQSVFGKRLGYLAGINYKQDYDFYDEGVVRGYEAGSANPTKDKQDAMGTIEYIWSAMASLGLELTDNHEVGFNYLYVRSAEDVARRLVGYQEGYATPADGTYLDQSELHWTERELSFYQLYGGHEFTDLNNTRFDWAGSYATTFQDEPDQRFFQFIADPNGPFYDPVGPSVPIYPTRLFRTINEENLSLRGDVTVTLPSYNAHDNTLKTGVASSSSEREYNSRGFEINRYSGNPFQNEGDPNDFATPENQQYIQYRNIPANWNYDGDQSVESVYLMGDWATLDWLRISGGARVEATEINVTSVNTTKFNETFVSSIEQTDVLPAVNLTISLRENLALRLSWSQTVVRPTYREISRAQIYDVAQDRIYSGSEGTQLSESENYDIRLDWYPREGSLVSVGAFYKHITDPIELVGQGTVFYVYTNYTPADVMGVEFELRDSLGNWWEPLAPFSVGLNAAYMQSEVTLTERDQLSRSIWGDTETTRPLYDQPDYIFNADLTWENKISRTTLTLSFGVVGPRLVAAGVATPDDIEQPAPQLDFFLTQRIGKHWKAKFSAKNLLDPEYQVTQDWPNYGERVTSSYTKGMTFGISVGCEF